MWWKRKIKPAIEVFINQPILYWGLITPSKPIMNETLFLFFFSATYENNTFGMLIECLNSLINFVFTEKTELLAQIQYISKVPKKDTKVRKLSIKVYNSFETKKQREKILLKRWQLISPQNVIGLPCKKYPLPNNIGQFYKKDPNFEFKCKFISQIQSDAKIT